MTRYSENTRWAYENGGTEIRLFSLDGKMRDLKYNVDGSVFTLSRKRVDLAEVARSSVEALQLTGASNRRQLSVQTSIAWVDGDPTRLSQIATNLVENALKYTPDGGRVELTVAPDGPDAVLAVRDTGVGIGPELLSRVFDVFVQGPASLDRSKGGLGIGLAVVSALVEQHGGTVVAESAGEGLGSCFTVRLPLLHAQGHGLASRRHTHCAACQRAADPGRRRQR